MRVTVIPVVIGALGTAPQKLGKGAGRVGNRERTDTIQITALSISDRVRRRVLKT